MSQQSTAATPELRALLDGACQAELDARAEALEAGGDPDDDSSEAWITPTTLGELLTAWELAAPYDRAARCGLNGPLDPRERKRRLAAADADLHALLALHGPDQPLAALR